MVSWNRLRDGASAADAFEEAGRPVLITENASWGNDFAGDSWLTLARSFHNVAGQFPIGDRSRWDNLELCLWQMRDQEDDWEDSPSPYTETVILPSRGIGPYPHRQPPEWLSEVTKTVPNARVRTHPGKIKPAVSLVNDLHKAREVITWGSGAAIYAAMWGIRVRSDMPRWIGQSDNTEKGRLQMFRDLAWAQWRLDEIRRGDAFAWLL